MQLISLTTALLTTLALLTPTLAIALPAKDTATPVAPVTAPVPVTNTNTTISPSIDLNKTIPFPFDTAHPEALVNIFDAIINLPDDLFEKEDNGAALHKYILEHGGAGLNVNLYAGGDKSSRSVELVERQGWVSIARCAFELGKVILENYIPLAKILRIKKLIKAIGNAKAVGKMLLKARSWKQLVAIGGAPLAKLAEELLGIRPVVDACFGFM